MTPELLIPFLGWTSLVNMALLLIWWGMIALAGDAIFRLHSRYFSFSRSDFDRFHYAAMGSYKLAILFFNLVPYLVLRGLH